MKIEWYGNRVFTAATAANIQAMHKAVILVANDVKTHFTLQGSGRLYRRGHRASRPGEPPAIDTGTLRSSIMTTVEIEPTAVVGKIGPDVEFIGRELAKRGRAGAATLQAGVEYGCYLEVGTARMAPRPFLRPALARTKHKVEKIFKQANG